MPDGSIVTGPGIGDGCSGCKADAGEKLTLPFEFGPSTTTRPAQPEPVVVREGAVRKNGRNQYPQANRPDTRPAGQGSQPEPVKPSKDGYCPSADMARTESECERLWATLIAERERERKSWWNRLFGRIVVP